MTNCCYIVFYFFMNLSNEINITINRNSTENITQIQAQNQQEIQIRRNISSNSISYYRYSMLVSSSAHLCHLFQTVVFWHRIFLHLKFDLRLFSPFLGNLFWHYLLWNQDMDRYARIILIFEFYSLFFLVFFCVCLGCVRIKYLGHIWSSFENWLNLCWFFLSDNCRKRKYLHKFTAKNLECLFDLFEFRLRFEFQDLCLEFLFYIQIECVSFWSHLVLGYWRTGSGGRWFVVCVCGFWRYLHYTLSHLSKAQAKPHFQLALSSAWA